MCIIGSLLCRNQSRSRRARKRGRRRSSKVAIKVVEHFEHTKSRLKAREKVVVVIELSEVAMRTVLKIRGLLSRVALEIEESAMMSSSRAASMGSGI